MSTHDPGAHDPRRSYGFLPYHWRRCRHFADTAWDAAASYGIVAAVCIVMAIATLAVIIMPFILGDTPTATEMCRSAANIVLACAILLMLRAGWQLFH